MIEQLGRLIARVPRTPLEDPTLLGRRALTAVAVALTFASATTGSRAGAAGVVGLLAGWRLGSTLHERASRAAHADVRRATPDLLDRLTVCIGAGMSVERALRTVTPRTPGTLGEALAAGLRALDLGLPRARAYEAIALGAGAPEIMSLTAALARAERYGTSVADALAAQAAELRSRARAAAEAEARTAPVRLIFPVVLCFLPAFVVLSIAPIALSAIRTIGGI